MRIEMCEIDLVCRPYNRVHSMIEWELGDPDATVPVSPTGTIGSSLMTIVPQTLIFDCSGSPKQ